MTDPVAAPACLASVESPTGKVNVALTGTSNCIFVNGISFGMGKHPGVEKFLNRSLGASGTVAIAAHLQDFDLSGYHYVFIDYCINESGALAQGMERIENSYRHIAAMVDHAARAGCVPVLVNLPYTRSVGRSNPVIEMLRRDFVARGVALFDVQHLLEAWAQDRGVDVGQCFFDAMHLKRPLAFALGEIMIDAADRARQAGAIAAAASLTDARYGSVGYLPAATLGSEGIARIERSNRLVTMTLLQMRPGDRVVVPCGDGGARAIRGVAYNAARTIGALTAPSGEALIDIKRNHLFGMERDLSIAIVPSPPANIPFSTDMVLTYPGGDGLPEDSSPTAFELAGLVVHDLERDHPLHVIAVAPDQRHLHETLGPADMARLDAAWAATLEG